MKKVYDVVWSRKFLNRKGEEQKQYINIGSVIEGDRGLSIKLESIPIGWDGWASMYEPKPKEDRGQSEPRRAPERPRAEPKDDDDVPY